MQSKGGSRRPPPSRGVPPAPQGEQCLWAPILIQLSSWRGLPHYGCPLIIHHPWGVPGTYRNGAPQFPRGDGHAKRDTYTTPQKQARAPPATALPPQNASRRSKARPPSEQNMEFLNVPDQGVAG